MIENLKTIICEVNLMANITAIILTRNEEKYIGDCIKSLWGVVKRIVVVDSFSNDHTIEIAKALGAEVYQHEFFNYAKQYSVRTPFLSCYG